MIRASLGFGAAKEVLVNQVFKITVGPETIDGRLPPRRVGQHFNCRFHIGGVSADSPTAPKIWVSTDTGSLFWIGEFDATLGVWVVEVNGDATETVGSYVYALTVYGEEAGLEYIAGQGAFSVYSSIASGGETGGTGGESVYELLEALTARVETLESKAGKVPMFDDIDSWVALYASDTDGIKSLTFEVPA